MARVDPLAILVVDDHPVVVGGLVASLSAAPDLLVVAQAGSLEVARHVLDEMPIDVGLVDIRLPDGSGLDLIGSTDHGGRRPAWIVLSSFENAQYVSAAVRLGAAGFLLKTAPIDRIIEAVRESAGGSTVFNERHELMARDQRRLALSRREHEIVCLLTAGMSNGEIAARLGIARKTVEADLTQLFGRFGVESRLALALLAERNGFDAVPWFPRTSRASPGATRTSIVRRAS